MPRTEKRMEELLEKANKMPLCPGVYLMKDKKGDIIYVGKSRKLKNRVSQYFQNSKKNIKTEKMILGVEDFDYILCKTEIEALTLENTLIKKYSPRYNIKLKDAKSYPYIKITDEEFPRIIFTRTRSSDKGKYFGPFSGVSTVYSVLDTLHKSLGIPTCKHKFPKDIGKVRPCIYSQIGRCCSVCTGSISSKDYGNLIRCAENILKGNEKSAVDILQERMLEYAENEQYEAAARCRDSIKALTQLNQKQNVVASPDTNADVFGMYSDGSFACISVMYVRNGAVINKVDFSISAEAIADSSSMCAFIVDHYMMNTYVPKLIAISFELEESDLLGLEAFLLDKHGSKVEVRHPIRGRMKELCLMTCKNAEEKVKQSALDAQKDEGVLFKLANMLMLETIPERIEAYDISNIGAEHITAGMVVFKNGKPSRADYRSFNIRSVSDKNDDYQAMKEALKRRFRHLHEDRTGSFSEYPDMILVDGGKGHVSTAIEAMNEEGIFIPVFGMVKDDFHKTRALCTNEQEINIAKEQSIFVFLYKIQEEVHRYTVGKMSNAKRKTLKHSSLEKIKGIGPAKAQKLMKEMKTLSAIRSASVETLESISCISHSDAEAIYLYFRGKTEK